jgi:hypothetical protein
MLPNKVQMKVIVEHLQKVLHIQDVDITLNYVDQYKMKCLYNADNYDTAMMCERLRLRKEAVIYINVDHQCNETDWYDSIVHELYHIVDWDLSDLVDDLLDEIDSSEVLRRHKKEVNETMVVKLTKIFTNIYPVTNFIKEGCA